MRAQPDTARYLVGLSYHYLGYAAGVWLNFYLELLRGNQPVTFLNGQYEGIKRP